MQDSDITEEKEVNEAKDTHPQRLLSWSAPLRPYKKRSPLILRFYFAVSLLLAVIIYFFGDKVLILVVLSLLFLFYAMTITPPTSIVHTITRFGVEAYGTIHPWNKLAYFYFIRRFGYDVLVLVEDDFFNEHVYLVVPNTKTKEEIIHILSAYIPYQENPTLTFSDKLIGVFSALIPQEENEVGEQKPKVSTPQPPLSEPKQEALHQQ